MQPIIATLILMVAGRGIAQLITGGQIITIYNPPYDYIGNGIPARPALCRRTRRGCRRAVARAAHRHATRDCSYAPSASIRWRRASPACARGRSRCASTASAASWPGSPASSSVPTSRARTQQCRHAARARRHSRRDARRHCAHRRPLQPRRHRDRRADHPDAHVHYLLTRRATRGEPGVQGGAHLRGDAAAVGGVPGEHPRAGLAACRSGGTEAT